MKFMKYSKPFILQYISGYSNDYLISNPREFLSVAHVSMSVGLYLSGAQHVIKTNFAGKI
jgi:hypothetical protein